MDEDGLRTKLSGEVERVSWHPLLPHHERGHLWLLDAGLDLVQVGLKVALDELSVVSGWIQEGRIRRPVDSEVHAWTEEPLAQHFEFVIVQPFVFAIERRGLREEAAERDES